MLTLWSPLCQCWLLFRRTESQINKGGFWRRVATRRGQIDNMLVHSLKVVKYKIGVELDSHDVIEMFPMHVLNQHQELVSNVHRLIPWKVHWNWLTLNHLLLSQRPNQHLLSTVHLNYHLPLFSSAPKHIRYWYHRWTVDEYRVQLKPIRIDERRVRYEIHVVFGETMLITIGWLKLVLKVDT